VLGVAGTQHGFEQGLQLVPPVVPLRVGGEARVAGRPSARNSADEEACRSAAQIVMSRSRQANVSKGAIAKCALPMGAGSLPVASQDSAAPSSS
jgi:hypothetical protein